MSPDERMERDIEGIGQLLAQINEKQPHPVFLQTQISALQKSLQRITYILVVGLIVIFGWVLWHW